MTPTPPSTSSSLAGHSPEGQYRVVRKRNRVPLSCAPCRQRKLKCNRSNPCENCVKRGDASSCSYAQPGSRKKNSLTQSASSSPDDMQNRIDRLESLVLSLMTNGSQSAGPAAAVAAISGNDSIGSAQTPQDLELEDEVDGLEESDTEAVTKSFGVMKMDNNKSMYISEAHWASVLNDIAEVRQFFSSHKKQYEEQAQRLKASKPEVDTSMLLFGSIKTPSKAEIMASFPSRYTTDMLIARYFNTSSPATHVIHVPTFQKEYNEHWKDPSASCPVWIGMLYAMMRLAMLSYNRDGDEPPEFIGKSLDMARNFRHLMSQCLILADYTKPYPYLIETLILHLHGDFNQTKDADVSVWIMVGIIMRLAMRMGYHRDSKMFPNITPFQGEMRRRVWSVVRQADILFSFQVGMPSMLRTGDSDTEIPRNLYDEDFDQDSKELPPPRPNEEPTAMSYLIAKARLSFTFARVVEHTSAVTNAPHETAMEIDAELRRARELIPDHLRVRPMNECQHDPADLIASRFHIQSVYHKAQCVLHRQYIARARDNPRFTHSRRTCIDSSMELLQYQSMLHQESGLNGRLRSQRSDNSITNNNFLLAATIICLDLYHGLQLQAAGRPSGDLYTWGRERRDEMLEAIQKAHQIWTDQKDKSMEAYKASGVLRVMLAKLTFSPQPPTTDTTNPTLLQVPDEKQNAAMTLGLLSSGMSPQHPGTASFTGIDSSLPSAGFATDPLALTSPFGMFGQVPEMQLDWDAWDSYISNSTLDQPNTLWPMLDITQQSPGTISQPTNPPLMDGVRVRNRLPGVLPSDTGMVFDPSAPGTFMAGPNSKKSSPQSQQQEQQQFSALRPAARRFLTTRSATVFSQSRSITSITPSSVRLNRATLASFPVQRRWNSTENKEDDLPKSADNADEERTLEHAISSAHEQQSTMGEAASYEETEMDTRDLSNDVPTPVEPFSEHRFVPKESVYIGNLFFDVTAEDLKERMSEYGVVVHSKIIHDGRGLSKGFGYVTFESIDSAARAIAEMNQAFYEGRRTIVQYASGTFQASDAKPTRPPSRTLFVGNLAFDLTDRELNDIFKSVRNVIDVRVAVDRKTGQPRGFAHADFLDVASAQVAAEVLASKAPHGRRLRVDFSGGAKRAQADQRKEPKDDEDF